MRYDQKMLAELKKMLGIVAHANNIADIDDLLAILRKELKQYSLISKNERHTPLQGARLLIAGVARNWSDTGKLERLAETDPEAYQLFERLFRFSEEERPNHSEEEFWSRLRAAYGGQIASGQ